VKKTIQETIDRLCEGKINVDEAVNELVSDAGIKVGTTVAVLSDPTYPFDGQKGVVRKIREDGYAMVEFDNGTEVPLQISLLVSV
jgi:transcription antitermination factor NusG